MRTTARTTTARLTGLGAVTGLTALALAVPATAQTDGDPAALSVLHGVPDLPVDVYVDGELTLDDFAPADLAGPLELPAGTYAIALTAADATDDSDPVLGPIDVTLDAGGNYTAVAHLAENGDPTATVFPNDTSAIAAGEGRLTVRHVAAAPAVDVLAGGEPVITELMNPNEEALALPAGTVTATVAPAGTTDPVIGPADIPVQDGVNTIVYAWGSLEEDSLAVATQTIEGLGSAPDGVPTGLVEVNEGGVPVLPLVGLGAVLALGAGALGARKLAAAR